jgi:tetratricopeptide (TPR) repeat protein
MGKDSPESRRGRKGVAHTFSPAPACRSRQMDVLREVDGGLGVVLWEALRAVWDWVLDAAEGRTSSEPKSERGEIHPRWSFARLEAPELLDPLGTFAGLSAAPLLVTPVSLAEAAHRVARWAEDKALNETAIQFAEAAAAVEPDNAEWANLAGRMCRRAGELPRADQWYDRAIGLARQTRNRREWVFGNLGAGTTAYRQGRKQDARRHFLSVAWKTRDSGHKAAAAKSQHDLMLISAETGDLRDALEHARRAFDWYPKHHRRMPYFAHDFAFLAVLCGASRPARRLLEAVLQRIQLPHEQLLVWGTLARAAAEEENQIAFRRARTRVATSSALYPEHAAPALVNAAIGSARVGDVQFAERFARTAQQLARTRGLREPERVAEAVLSALAGGTPPLQPQPGNFDERELLRLVEEVLQRLARWRGPTWRPRHQSESADDIQVS